MQNKLVDFFNWIFLEETLIEIQSRVKHGYPKLDRSAQINSYAKYGYLAHFGDLGTSNRFSPNRYTKKQKFDWNTPSGIYGYPLDLLADKVSEGNVPFPENAKRLKVYILKINQPSKLLNLESVTDAELEELKQKLVLMFPDKTKFISSSKTLKEVFFLIRELANFDSYEWSQILKKLGFVGIYDPGLGLIHPNEPVQAVIFGPQFLEVVDIIAPASESTLRKIELLAKNKDYRNIQKILDDMPGEAVAELAQTTKNVDLIKFFVQHDNVWLRVDVAQNPNIPENLALELTKDSEAVVRQQIQISKGVV